MKQTSLDSLDSIRTPIKRKVGDTMIRRKLSNRYHAVDATEYKTGRKYITYYKDVGRLRTLFVAHRCEGQHIQLEEPCFTYCE